MRRDRLRRDFDAYIVNVTRSGLRARLGKQNADDTWTVQVPGRAGYYYARPFTSPSALDATAGALEVIANGTSPIADMPVLLERTETGEWEIKRVDTVIAQTFAGDAAVAYHTEWHTHDELTYGLWDWVSMRRLLGGVIGADTGLTVKTYGDLFYVYGGEHRYLAEDTAIDLTAYQPAAAIDWCWVKVGLDPDAGALVAVAGADQAQFLALNLSALDDIPFAGYFPLGGVKLRGDATAIYDTDCFDCRPILNLVAGDLTGLLTDANGDVLSDADGNILWE